MKCPKCGFEMIVVNTLTKDKEKMVQYMCRNKKCSEFGGKSTNNSEKLINIPLK